ncbi:hypothetical protein BD413DRAFT_466919 [Trametes elegans]|nr:hypothetical protein BD413DRAFT_466919 [Trametes elegans]
MYTANVPHKLARLATLFLTFAFGVIGFAMGIHALVKSNDQKDLVKQEAPMGATVNIDTDDVFQVGCVVTAVCGALAVVSLVSLALLFFNRPSTKSSEPLSTRTLPLQAGLLAFLTVWLFASLVAMTDFVANRQAKVSAFLGSVQLDDSIIKLVEGQLGVTSVYKDIGYLRLAVILPWIAFLFGAVSSVVSIAAARRARHATPVFDTSSTNVVNPEREASVKEKGDADVKQVQV